MWRPSGEKETPVFVERRAAAVGKSCTPFPPFTWYIHSGTFVR